MTVARRVPLRPDEIDYRPDGRRGGNAEQLELGSELLCEVPRPEAAVAR